RVLVRRDRLAPALARRGPAAAARAGPRAGRPWRAAVPRRPRRKARPAAGVRDRLLDDARSGTAREKQPAHAPPLVRDAPPRGRRRPEDRSGIAWTCEYLNDPALPPCDARGGATAPT